MSGERYLTTWDDLIEYLIERSFDADEIRSEFDQRAHRLEEPFRASTRAGELLDWGTLHGRRRVDAMIVAKITARPVAIAHRPRGRPKGSRTIPRDQLVATFRRLQRQYGQAPTQAQLAANLSPRIEVRTLQAHLREYGLGWPIE